MELNLSDQILVVIYLCMVIFTGFKFAKSKKSQDEESDYLLAGRSLTLPLFVATLVATWYGSILGVGEFVYKNGITAWLTLGLPYYIAAIIFAFVLSKNIRLSEAKTIPEQFSKSYGKAAGLISSIIILIITIPAAYILMLGILTKSLTGLSLEFSIIISTIVSFLYIYHGGFKSDVYANLIQMIFMYLGFGVLIYFCIQSFGSVKTLITQLPSFALNPLENYSWQYLITWYIIAFQTFVDPSFFQRCAAAKNEKVAKNGILVSVLLWIVFDMLTLFTGLYALANLEITNPVDTFLVLGNTILPQFFKGIFFVALLSTVMSTLSSYGFLSAQTIGNDIIKPIESKFNLSLNSKTLTKIALIVSGVIGITIAIYLPSVIDIFYNTASISIPGLLFPMLISFSKKFKLQSKDALIIMISSTVLSSFWLAASKFQISGLSFTQNIEAMIFGLFVSFALSLFFVKRTIEESH